MGAAFGLPFSSTDKVPRPSLFYRTVCMRAGMADCNNLSSLTPYETYRCFVDADAWKVIQRNGQKMWADFSGTTNGEWLGITLALVTIPAQFASYILPLYFVARVFNRARRHGDVTATAKQKASKTRWGWYLIVCGSIMAFGFHQDKFMLYQGTWEILCGVAIFLFGDSFWASPESYQTKEFVREGIGGGSTFTGDEGR